jgi:Peptidase family M28/PA domain
VGIRDDVSAAELDRFLRGVASEVRLSGSPEEARAFDFIQRELEGFGYQVERFAIDALVGYPLTASLEILGPDARSVHANGYSLSPGTGPDGIVGEVVFVGAGMPADYAGVDVRGKIVLSEGLAMPAKARAASLAGAAGHIHINDDHIHEMCLSPVWGTPTPETAPLLPDVPGVGVDARDGADLRRRARAGELRVRLVTEPFRAWTAIPTLTAELPGTSDDRFVLFSGHVDSWHLGVMDNGTANATQLEVARLLAARRGELRRGVRLAFWSGHSHARYAASAWYADTHWNELHERCVCHVNIDSVGAKGASILEEAPTMAETFAFGRRIIADLTGKELDYRRISRSSDQSFWGVGVPTLFATLSEQARDDSAAGAAMAQLLGGGGRGGGLGWWWHTTEDTIDKIDPEHLARDAGIYAETLFQLCTLERLPFDYAGAADEIAAALARHEEASAGRLDLGAARQLAADLAAAIREGGIDRLDARAANDLVMALGRTLIPVNYTQSGQFEHDLALGSQALPGLTDCARLGALDPASDDARFLRTRLGRERNRVEHALRTALRLVRQAGASAQADS